MGTIPNMAGIRQQGIMEMNRICVCDGNELFGIINLCPYLRTVSLVCTFGSVCVCVKECIYISNSNVSIKSNLRLEKSLKASVGLKE